MDGCGIVLFVAAVLAVVVVLVVILVVVAATMAVVVDVFGVVLTLIVVEKELDSVTL